MVREVCEHSGKTFKQYQLFYLQKKQMLPAITVTWQRQTLSIVGVAAHHVCPQTILTLGVLQPLKQWTSNIEVGQGEDGHQGVDVVIQLCFLTGQHVRSLPPCWGSSFFPLSFVSLAFSLTFLLLILRWILGHSMTVNVAVSDCTEWDDSILATHWKAI